MKAGSIVLCLLPAVLQPAAAALLEVGPTRALTSIAEAARVARDGDTVQVDAGTYTADVASWRQQRLTLRAVGGRVRLLAGGAAAEGKAIWVIRGQDVQVEGFDFEGAHVKDHNGAGIRFESGSLTVRDCRFIGNQMGLLTSNDAQAELVVERSEFAYNLRPDGHNHNLYVGRIARVTVTGSRFHHARTGHLLKSRAAVSRILYNRLTDEAGGRASYELEFPNGGDAVVIGNLIEQRAETENPVMVSFGAEGHAWPRNTLTLAHNTLIDRRPAGGVFVKVWPGATAHAVNNLAIGAGRYDGIDPGGFIAAAPGDVVALDDYDLRLVPGSPPWGRAVDPGTADGLPLHPQAEFSAPRGTRPLPAATLQPGALQSSTPLPTRAPAARATP